MSKARGQDLRGELPLTGVIEFQPIAGQSPSIESCELSAKGRLRCIARQSLSDVSCLMDGPDQFVSENRCTCSVQTRFFVCEGRNSPGESTEKWDEGWDVKWRLELISAELPIASSVWSLRSVSPKQQKKAFELEMKSETVFRPQVGLDRRFFFGGLARKDLKSNSLFYGAEGGATILLKQDLLGQVNGKWLQESQGLVGQNWEMSAALKYQLPVESISMRPFLSLGFESMELLSNRENFFSLGLGAHLFGIELGVYFPAVVLDQMRDSIKIKLGTTLGLGKNWGLHAYFDGWRLEGLLAGNSAGNVVDQMLFSGSLQLTRAF